MEAVAENEAVHRGCDRSGNRAWVVADSDISYVRYCGVGVAESVVGERGGGNRTVLSRPVPEYSSEFMQKREFV